MKGEISHLCNFCLSSEKLLKMFVKNVLIKVVENKFNTIYLGINWHWIHLECVLAFNGQKVVVYFLFVDTAHFIESAECKN